MLLRIRHALRRPRRRRDEEAVKRRLRRLREAFVAPEAAKQAGLERLLAEFEHARERNHP